MVVSLLEMSRSQRASKVAWDMKGYNKERIRERKERQTFSSGLNVVASSAGC